MDGCTSLPDPFFGMCRECIQKALREEEGNKKLKEENRKLKEENADLSGKLSDAWAMVGEE